MDDRDIIRSLWESIAAQNADGMRRYFDSGAEIRWHNTNELFTLEEYITANCRYPGDWRGEVERVETAGDLVVSAAAVWLADRSASFHAVTFYRFRDGRILQADEYWGDDGAPPSWRQNLHIGRPIR